MPLEDPTVIDMAARTPDGGVNLLITDSGQTTDPDQRLAMLVEKLRAYMMYVNSEEFAHDHVDVPLDKVTIVVACAEPPTDAMLQIDAVQPKGDATRKIAVKFAHIPMAS